MSKVDEIKSQLAQRLSKQAAQSGSSTKRARSAPKTRVVTSTRDGDKAPSKKQDSIPQGVIKQSVSLYSPDITRLDEIKDFMRTHGVRNLSDSEAMRLACRAVKVSEEFLSIYETMLREDQRRKNTQKSRSAPLVHH